MLYPIELGRLIKWIAGYDPVPSVWKTDMLPVTPYPHMIGRLGIEPRSDAYKTPVLTIELPPITIK